MPPDIQATVYTTQAWLQSSWHIQVPFAWLEACVGWLQEEAGGAGCLSQQQINQQALDQWLLTDLRDLDYPVLPEGLGQAQKTELSGTYCVQVDSLLDISQPAYSQLQKWRGTECANDEVSAVTQTTQKSWEARPTRMLLLQVTDGVQNLEAMEYLPIPAFSSVLRPGAKLQLQGQMVCRLGVLLLGPSNIKILGGEVEDLVDRNHQGRVLCRTLGLQEEQQQEGEEATPALQQGNQEVDDMESDLELDDPDLLASLEAQEVMEGAEVGCAQDSGYRTLGESSTQSSRSSSIRSLVSAASSRSEDLTQFYTSGLTQGSRGDSVHNHRNAPSLDNLPSEHVIQQDIQQDHNMAGDDFPDEAFDDLPLDELDSVIYEESTNVVMQSDSSHTSTSKNNITITGNLNSLERTTKTAQLVKHTSNGSGSCINSRSTAQKRDYQGFMTVTPGPSAMAMSRPFFSPSHELKFVSNDKSDFMDEDIEEVKTYIVQNRRSGAPNQLPVQQEPRRDCYGTINKTETSGSSSRFTSESVRNETDELSVKIVKPALESSLNTLEGQSSSLNTRESGRLSDSTVLPVTLTSPPFTYLCLLEELISSPQPHTTEICIKAFIVTLLGKLSSNNGIWCICATISDGTGYLDVELSDEVLTRLLGFSVAEKAVLKRDPTRKGELDIGMKRCQEELVDMCCVMTIVVEPEDKKAVMTKADPVDQKVLQELERRVRDRRK
ncbi:RecQ-mediated genome instability protein 1 [Channa argus]|uniref:RecQ-mediated genome instability protein 1 n=1 Tax=Channa argus TaxID=215402 RepID=A0A6G1PZE1_CHAAH|nr:RecQ-mediated genome instability protein 1 [Channa argus]